MGPGATPFTRMPLGPSCFAKDFTKLMVAALAVLTYLRNRWGHAAMPVSPHQVAGLRAKLARPP